MELRRTETGFALYKEKEVIGHCTLHPAAQGADLAALAIDPAWRRKGYGSYLLKEVLRSFGGYDREAATVFTAPLPADCAEMAFWAKFGFAAEGPQLVRRRTPDLTAERRQGFWRQRQQSGANHHPQVGRAGVSVDYPRLSAEQS